MPVTQQPLLVLIRRSVEMPSSAPRRSPGSQMPHREPQPTLDSTEPSTKEETKMRAAWMLNSAPMRKPRVADCRQGHGGQQGTCMGAKEL